MLFELCSTCTTSSIRLTFSRGPILLMASLSTSIEPQRSKWASLAPGPPTRASSWEWTTVLSIRPEAVGRCV